MANVYDINNKYLYEILEDYKLSNDKDEIFQCFMKQIWMCNNSRQIYTKNISFSVAEDLKNTDVGKIFTEYQRIPYISSKTITKKNDYVNLIRQKINNIYNSYCEKRLCIKKDYMDLLHIPKKLYYRWEKNNNDECVENLKETIQNSLDKAQNLKSVYAKQKMELTWKQFKPTIENIIRKAFNNYIPLDEYEDKNHIIVKTDLWTDDNFCIKYICKCLQQDIKHFQKEYYGVGFLGNRSAWKYARCSDCGKLIVIKIKDNQTKRCKECQHKHLQQLWRESKRKQRMS